MSKQLLPSMHHSWAPVHLLASLIHTDYDTHHHEKWGINMVLVLKHSPGAMGKHLPVFSLWFIRLNHQGLSRCAYSALASLMLLHWFYVWWIYCVFVATHRDVDWSFSGSLCWWWGTLLWVLSLKSSVNSWHVCAVNTADSHLVNVLSGAWCLSNCYDTCYNAYYHMIHDTVVWSGYSGQL